MNCRPKLRRPRRGHRSDVEAATIVADLEGPVIAVTAVLPRPRSTLRRACGHSAGPPGRRAGPPSVRGRRAPLGSREDRWSTVSRGRRPEAVDGARSRRRGRSSSSGGGRSWMMNVAHVVELAPQHARSCRSSASAAVGSRSTSRSMSARPGRWRSSAPGPVRRGSPGRGALARLPGHRHSERTATGARTGGVHRVRSMRVHPLEYTGASSRADDLVDGRRLRSGSSPVARRCVPRVDRREAFRAGRGRVRGRPGQCCALGVVRIR